MLWNMMGPIILGQIRHLLTGFGGVLVGTGYVSGEEASTIVGALIALVGAAWSIFQKYRTQPDQNV